jgi:hypothetical protein
MRHYRSVNATVAACSSVLFLTAASFIVACEATQSQRSQSSATTGMATFQVADEETSVPPAGADESQKDNPPLMPPTTVLDKNEGRGILGTSVRSATNEDMGRVVDVIVDRSGIIRAAVIDFGGFLGVGSRKIAVDWNAVRFGGDSGVSIDLTRDQVRTAPQYQEGKPIMVLGAAPGFTRSRFTARLPEQ